MTKDDARWNWWVSLRNAATEETLADLEAHQGWIMNSFDRGWESCLQALDALEKQRNEVLEKLETELDAGRDNE